MGSLAEQMEFLFMWLMAHAGLPVGTWAAACVRCILHSLEFVRHCLWVCTRSHLVCKAVCLLLIRFVYHKAFLLGEQSLGWCH